MNLEFCKQQRLRTTEEFRRCYNDGARAGDDHVLVFAVFNQTHRTRIGVSVSKKHGNAVARNRKKRLLRESYRLSQHDLPQGLDIVLVPRQKSDSTLDDYRSSLKHLIKRIVRRLSRNATESS